MAKEITPEIKAEIYQSLEGRLSREESKILRDKIKDEFKIEYGSSLKDVLCPNTNCNKPLMLTFANGPSCYECRTMGTDLLYFPETKSAA